MDAYVVTDMPATVEYGSLDDHVVHVRFDDNKAVSQRWSQSTDNKALFSPSPRTLLKATARAKSFRFEFVPFNGNTQVVDFDVTGFDAPYKEIIATCERHR